MATKNARRFNQKLISLAVASCFAAGSAYGQALPTGANPITGISSVVTNGATMDVTTNLNRSLIQWNTFNIGQGGTVNFIQPSSLSAVMNRVMGGVPSDILGAMNSNGRVYLINPNGITFGAGAQINVAGLVASTLNLSDQDFLANRLRFTGGVGAGSVINEANSSITSATGGEVYLVGKSVTNSGTITSPRGEVVLAAGNSVELVSPGTPNLRVEVTAPDNQAVNLGTIVADAGRVGIYAGLVTQGGTIRADGAQMTDDGRIVLKATKNVIVAANSITSASGPKGGTVDIQGGDLAVVLGDVSATGSVGKGGTVRVLGNLVGVMGNATIDASGETGGGTVLVGGDFQGKNPAIPNAFRTTFGPDATIKADAITNGDGGKVIVWSDDATRAYGTISARGGSQGGDGGFVEVSGKRWLDFQAKVDTRAPRGKAGTLLLDPNDVQILAGTCCGAEGGFVGGGEGPEGPPSIWFPSGTSSTSVVTWGDAETGGTIIGNLQNNNVIVTTSSTGPQAGDITVVNGATYNSSNSLTLAADRHITVNGVSIVNDGTGDINLFAGGSIGVTSSTIETGGSLALSAGGNINILGESFLGAGVGGISARHSFLTVSAGGAVTIAEFSSLSARGSDNFAGPGFNGVINISGASVGIFDANIEASGGNGTTAGGVGQVFVSSGSSLTIDHPESASTFIGAFGGHASIGGPEGSSGGLASVILNAAGALSINGGARVVAEGGRSHYGPGGPGQVMLFGSSISLVRDGCCGDTIYARGGEGSQSWSGGAGSVSMIAGTSILIDGAEGRALGGFGGARGGDGVVTMSSGGGLTLMRGSNIRAWGGEGNNGGGNASVGMSSLNDMFILGSHVEAEGGFAFSGLPGGTSVVSLTSSLKGINIDGAGAPGSVLAYAWNGAEAEVSLKAFDIISVNNDWVEASSIGGEGATGPAQIKLHFTGRNSGGWFVNGVEAPNPPGAFPPESPPAFTVPSGFFVNGEPAQPGVNFFVTYAGALPDPCLLAPEICAPPRIEPPNINEASEKVGTDDKKKKDEPVCRG